MTQNYIMLKNYEETDFGIIKQLSKTKTTKYGKEYSDKYNQYGIKGTQLAHLRLGVLLGVLGNTPSSILDVGYGNGDFLNAAKQIIPSCYGNDLTSEYTVPEDCVFVNNIYDIETDVITFFDSLEHFEDIFIIDRLHTKYIMISVPWCHYFSNEWFETWVHRRPDEHLWHFNDIALKSFFNHYGYKCIYSSNVEDTIRKRDTLNNSPNILTCIFEKL